MWPLKTILYFGFFWLACFVALFNPIWGVVNYVMAYQTNPATTWWGKPLDEAGMRFSLMAVVFTLLGLFFGRKRVPDAKPWMTWWEMGAVILVLIAFVNVFLGMPYNHRVGNAIEKLWKMMVFVLILTRLGSSRAHLRLLLWALVFGSFYIGYDAFTANPKDFALGRLNRIGGPDFATSSGTAAHLTAMLPLIGTAFLISRSWKARGLALIAGGLTCNAIILCRTRSAFVGLLIGLLTAAVMAPKARRWRIQILLVIGVVLGLSLTDPFYWSRMMTLTDRQVLQQDGAAVGRTEIWKASWNILMDHPVGVGAGNFPRIIGQYDSRYAKRSAHNTVVVCFVELGLHGGFVFVFMTLAALFYLFRSSHMAEMSQEPQETKYLTYGFLVSFVTYFTTGLGTERFYCESFWWVFGLPVCLYRVCLTEQETVSAIENAEFADKQSASWVRSSSIEGEKIIDGPARGAFA